MSVDNDKLLQRLMGTFLGELEEQVQSLNRDLLALEQQPGDPELELLTRLFRTAHSLKGAARAVGVEPIETACHQLEELLGKVRDEGFQLVQSFVAFGRGGALGVGVGDGRQKLFYLPEAHTDFILSVVAEELDIFGVLVVVGSFAAITIAGLRIARRARDPFVLLVATGMTAIIVVPAAINAAVVMGVAPTTGLTLPFLSHGGNSLACTAVALGVLLRIAAREAPAQTARVRGAATRGFLWA